MSIKLRKCSLSCFDPFPSFCLGRFTTLSFTILVKILSIFFSFYIFLPPVTVKRGHKSFISLQTRFCLYYWWWTGVGIVCDYRLDTTVIFPMCGEKVWTIFFVGRLWGIALNWIKTVSCAALKTWKIRDWHFICPTNSISWK